jgi:hypothetical protein
VPSAARDNAFSMLVVTASSSTPARDMARAALARIAAHAPAPAVRREAARQLAQISGSSTARSVTAGTPGHAAFIAASVSRGLTAQQAEYAWVNSDAAFHAAWEARGSEGRLSGLGAVLAVM